MVALSVIGGLSFGEVVQAAQVVQLHRQGAQLDLQHAHRRDKDPSGPHNWVCSEDTHVGAADALQQQPGDLGLPVKLGLGDPQLMFCLQEEVPVTILVAGQDQNQPPTHTHLLCRLPH